MYLNALIANRIIFQKIMIKNLLKLFEVNVKKLLVDYEINNNIIDDVKRENNLLSR